MWIESQQGNDYSDLCALIALKLPVACSGRCKCPHPNPLCLPPASRFPCPVSPGSFPMPLKCHTDPRFFYAIPIISPCITPCMTLQGVCFFASILEQRAEHRRVSEEHGFAGNHVRRRVDLFAHAVLGTPLCCHGVGACHHRRRLHRWRVQRRGVVSGCHSRCSAVLEEGRCAGDTATSVSQYLFPSGKCSEKFLPVYTQLNTSSTSHWQA
jgi:hypothetical protein